MLAKQISLRNSVFGQEHRGMIFVELHVPWYMGRGKHIYRTNWDL